VARKRPEQRPVYIERKRSSGLVVSLLCVVFLAFMAAQWHERQKVAHFSVAGATGLSRIAVQRAVDSLRYRSIKSLSLANIRKYVEAIPYVRNASVFFSGVREITVHVEERLPIAHVLYEDGSLRYVDQYGTVLPQAGERTAHNVPVLRTQDGTRLSQQDILRMSAILVSASQVLDTRLYQSISEIRINQTRSAVSMVTDETVWNLGRLSSERIQTALADMNVFWRDAANTINMCSVREVDLRWHHQVVLRYHQQATMPLMQPGGST
jgi:cell division septal protein FtsQ